MVRFRAPIEQPGDEPNSWWILRVPTGADAALGKVQRVRGTVNGVPFAGRLMPMGGGVRCVNPTKAVYQRASAALGDVVDVALEPDAHANVVEVPDELATALQRRPALAKTFDGFSPSHRREFAQWITSAKKSETRVARAEKALAMIAERKRPSG